MIFGSSGFRCDWVSDRREPTGGRRKMLMRKKVGIMRTIIGGLL